MRAAVVFALLVVVAAISIASGCSGVDEERAGPGEVPTASDQRGSTAPAPSAGGTIAFDMDGDIYTMNLDGTRVRNVTDTDGSSESAPAWSPDGRWLVFVACTECTTSDVYVMNADGGEVTRLTDDAALDDAPAWSPDGTEIVYQSEVQAGLEPDDRDLYVVRADGTGKRRLTEGSALDGNPTWSPDGTRIAFDRLVGPSESSAIYVISVDGAETKRLSEPSLWALAPVWSPDGGRIAFNVVDEASTTPEVYLMSADGAGIRRLTDDPPASVRAWSPDGRALLIGRLGSRHSLHALDLATGDMTALFTAPEPQRDGVYIHNAAWSR